MMPDLETISYEHRTGHSSRAAAVDIPNCERRWPTTNDLKLASMWAISVDMVWHVWQSQLPFDRPKTGDIFTDGDSQKWIVQRATEELVRNRWRLYVIRGQQTSG